MKSNQANCHRRDTQRRAQGPIGLAKSSARPLAIAGRFRGFVMMALCLAVGFGQVDLAVSASTQVLERPYLIYAQSDAIKSKGEVIREVKRRYPNAKVLRVKLNQSGTAYQVRILLPNGKVKSIKISAN